MEEPKHFGIRLTGKFVRLYIDVFEIKFHSHFLDYDLLELPLPRYMPEMVVKMLKKMRSERASYALLNLVVEHEDWCAKSTTEFSWDSICSCNPVPRAQTIEVYKTAEYETLTCTECGESYTG